ncbi:hypothetical protein CLPUN_35680 [Clostridium puniceum]|uniref:Uncharacterized protein n=1 Tax=Clostridium puniceum TaxID=29367 RepID=A0A1S8TBZ5_9CLOT|nr:hypothetical protein [Clostridium puniceum]OOM75131.1 hypothetical protein CLPUN_35680 [Clostridium puniceum]
MKRKILSFSLCSLLLLVPANVTAYATDIAIPNTSNINVTVPHINISVPHITTSTSYEWKTIKGVKKYRTVTTMTTTYTDYETGLPKGHPQTSILYGPWLPVY